MSQIIYSVDGVSNFAELFLSINQTSNGWLAGLILIFIWIVVLSTTMLIRYPFNRAMAFSSSIVSILAVLLWAVGAVSTLFMVVPIVLVMISIGVFLFAK